MESLARLLMIGAGAALLLAWVGIQGNIYPAFFTPEYKYTTVFLGLSLPRQYVWLWTNVLPNALHRISMTEMVQRC